MPSPPSPTFFCWAMQLVCVLAVIWISDSCFYLPALFFSCIISLIRFALWLHKFLQNWTGRNVWKGIRPNSQAFLTGSIELPLLKDVELFECIQKKTTRLMRVLEDISCEESLRTLSFSGLEERRQRGDLTALYIFLSRGNWEGRAYLLSLGAKDRTCRSGWKLCRGLDSLDWTHFFALGEWSNTGMGILEMVINALSLSLFKGHLNNAINTMI